MTDTDMRYATVAPMTDAASFLNGLQALCDWQPSQVITATSDPEDLPLLYWLAGQIRPDRVLCLGVGDGAAYVTLCEAVRDAGLAAQVLGAELWTARAEPSSSGTVPAELAAHIRDHHAGRGQLIHAEPEDAARGFAPGSIDLLLIEETIFPGEPERIAPVWVSRMSERSAIILRGTSRAAQLGDLCARWPHLTLMQGTGVLLLPGAAPPNTLAAICDAAQDTPEKALVLGLLRRFGTALGDRAERARLAAAHVSAMAPRDAAIADLTRAAEASAKKLSHAEAQVIERTREIEALTRHAETLRKQLDRAETEARKCLEAFQFEASRRVNELKERLATAEGQRDEARKKLVEKRAEAADRVNELKARLATAVTQRDEARDKLRSTREAAEAEKKTRTVLQEKLDAQGKELATLHSSLSWRLTAPFRVLVRVLWPFRRAR